MDGSLIVLHKRGGGGIIAIVTFAYGKTVWIRFPPPVHGAALPRGAVAVVHPVATASVKGIRPGCRMNE